MQLEIRIGQCARDAERSERRTKRADDDSRVSAASAAAHDQSADHNVAADIDETACADVRQLRVRGLIKIVNFDNADAAPVVLTGKYRGVSPGRERGHDG